MGVPSNDGRGGRAPVLIVGAGPAGLATAAVLRRRGVPSTILERGERVAATWREADERAELESGRWAARLPGARAPRSAGRRPTCGELVAYLESYAERERLDVRTGIEATAVQPAHGWTVEHRDGSLRGSQVVVAIGAPTTDGSGRLGALVGHLGVLDDRGVPILDADRTNPASPGLFFAGVGSHRSGYLAAARRDARRIAAAIEPADPAADRWWIRAVDDDVVGRP